MERTVQADDMKIHILYVEDDDASGRLVRSVAEGEGYNLKIVTTGKEFLKNLTTQPADLFLLDLHLPDESGLDLLLKIREVRPQVPVIVVTASDSIEDVVTAMKRGATDYLTKPVDIQRMIVSLANGAKLARQQREIFRLRSDVKEAHALEYLVGGSPAMEQLRHLIRQAASSDATVLIAGESGTGKELVAKALHYSSSRATGPFIDVNSAALTETLLESELFGHERGAFTSAISRRQGRFEQADGGSLFLDEVGDMPLSTQAKILRALQERCFQRVGGEEKVSVDVRVICATNRNLEEAVAKGAFRMDLFYRINVFPIEVPPLRAHKSDIPELARHFLAQGRRLGKHRTEGISDPALEILCRHDWPGNVRELQNAIERALIVCSEDEIGPSHLPPAVWNSVPKAQASKTAHGLIQTLEELERSMVLSTLEKCAWNRSKAARRLGVTYRILSYKMLNLGIKTPTPEASESRMQDSTS
jgi:DNA-binding NtrC family response regulator